uniref:Uncharacterized protein n=1 Tax=Avena sativa TaxID=4498 RepID=A0ACD5U6Q7_AVESA
MDSAAPPPQPAAGGYAARFSPSGFIHAPLSALLEGVLRSQGNGSGPQRGEASPNAGGDGEVSIRIVGPDGGDTAPLRAPGAAEAAAADEEAPAARGDEAAAAGGGGGRADSPPYQGYDVQRLARWVEHALPFSLLLLGVFIRQHLQGFFVMIWIAAVMFKSNDILRKQTALKGERKMSMLVAIVVVFIFHVFGVYWWYRNDDLVRPLVMLPPKEIPPFWHAIFFIAVNDTMVRQAAMVVKCVLLMYYKNSKGRHYRRQGQMLTVVEYSLLLYRALLPAPVWYRFFLNKEYGGLFSSLTTGLYLTFKVASMVEKRQASVACGRAGAATFAKFRIDLIQDYNDNS